MFRYLKRLFKKTLVFTKSPSKLLVGRTYSDGTGELIVHTIAKNVQIPSFDHAVQDTDFGKEVMSLVFESTDSIDSLISVLGKVKNQMHRRGAFASWLSTEVFMEDNSEPHQESFTFQHFIDMESGEKSWDIDTNVKTSLREEKKDLKEEKWPIGADERSGLHYDPDLTPEEKTNGR